MIAGTWHLSSHSQPNRRRKLSAKTLAKLMGILIAECIRQLWN